MSNPRVRLADLADGPGRTPASLVASLSARFVALYVSSGSETIASLTAGSAALGREVSRTAEGSVYGRPWPPAGREPTAISVWSKLRLAEWTSGIFPSPVLDQLPNDMALLLAEDLNQVLDALPLPSSPVGLEAIGESPRVEFLDVLLGLWAFSRELTRAVETLAASSRSAVRIVNTAPPNTNTSGSILR
jgi:hypothetical protein